MIEIKTERLILKKPKSGDIKRLIDLIGDYRVSQTLKNVPHPYTDDDAEYWLKRVNNGLFNFSIFLDGFLIGGIGLASEDDGYCEFGYWLGFEYWGKGYATEASYELLNYAKTNTSCKKFKASVYKGNTASSKVLEKVGFKQTGEGEDFSLSKQENIPCLNYEYCF
jgi:RimJ/RimL family protein N-acetyltransferase